MGHGADVVNDAVIIGVGQVVHRDEQPGPEPIELARRALVAAAEDAGLAEAALTRLAAVEVVNLVSWPYEDPARALGEAVGARPASTLHTDWGGNQPTLRVDRIAERIAHGERGLVAVAGAEAFRSLERALRSGASLPWPAPSPDAPPAPDPRAIVAETAWKHGLRMPPEVYPLYENALRAALSMSFDEGQDWSARLWAAMSAVAANNDAAWNPTPMGPEEIRTVSERNRMVCFPYPKLMNALMSVDQGAAVLLADVATARALGAPESKWVYPWGGAGASEPDDFLARVGYDTAPAMNAVLDDVFTLNRLAPDELGPVELYSCFPCVPKLALTHLGWARDHPISVTGGLTFFGGAANNYMTHALVAMVRALRAGDGAPGLCYGQGGFVTKHHALVLGREPRHGGGEGGGVAADAARQERLDRLVAPRLEQRPHGEARVESYTAVYDRAGAPDRGIVVGRLPSGARFVANTPRDDDEQLAELLDPDREAIGRALRVEPAPEGQNHCRLT
jgi:acetyl-CoA C-acetyltransferase